CHIEIECLGQRIGIQDQYAVAYGGFNQYKFNNDGSVCVTPVVCKQENIEALKGNIMLFYTGLTRDSRKILSEQSDTIEAKKKGLDTLVDMTNTAYQLLQKGDIDGWGNLLDDAWEIKKAFAGGVSNELINDMYTKAKDNGALGGKILGAGGGGFLMMYVPKDKQEAVTNALSEYRKFDMKFDPQGSRIIFYD
ncbi:MAG: GHMP kinase, partial [Butyrivibrio sp.]|nr:GHMP kinase [Butyrivibrio sp.]